MGMVVLPFLLTTATRSQQMLRWFWFHVYEYVMRACARLMPHPELRHFCKPEAHAVSLSMGW